MPALFGTQPEGSDELKANPTTSGRTTDRTTAASAAILPGQTPAEWLEPFADTPEARHLARLEADVELVARAALAKFTGRDWMVIADLLVAYGLKVMAAWIATGQIYEKCEAKNLGLPPVGRFSSEVVNDLASETVARAYANFRDYVLPKGVWNPTKGASLTTFFIGQCLFRYPNVLRSHLRQVHRERPLRAGGPVDELEDVQVVDRRSAGTDAKAIGKITAVEQLEKFDPTTRAIIAFRSEGYSWDEVAELVGLSVPAAKSRLFRVQQPGEAS